MSEMYQELSSPLPTLVMHMDSGLGIFVALSPQPSMHVNSLEIIQNKEYRIVLSDTSVQFPLRPHALDLLNEKGGLLALTDTQGMPWFTQELPAARASSPVRPSIDSVGEFSL